MAHTKLISIRVSEDVLKVVDNYRKGRPYLTRSLLLNVVLEKALLNRSPKELYMLLSL